jgi:hypothetical protein
MFALIGCHTILQKEKSEKVWWFGHETMNVFRWMHQYCWQSNANEIVFSWLVNQSWLCYVSRNVITPKDSYVFHSNVMSICCAVAFQV